MMTNTERLQLIENLERAFEVCTHPYNAHTSRIDRDDTDWCIVCGARYLNGLWLKPHWRDIIVKVVFKE